MSGRHWQNSGTLAAGSPAQILAMLNPDPAHRGQAVDLLTVSVQAGKAPLMQHSDGSATPWDGNPATLAAARRGVVLNREVPLRVSEQLLGAGENQVFFAYRLADGTIVFNGGQALVVGR